MLAVVQRKAAEEEGRVHEDLLEDDVIFVSLLYITTI